MEGRGKREIIYISLHYHHQNDSCIKMDCEDEPLVEFMHLVYIYSYAR